MRYLLIFLLALPMLIKAQDSTPPQMNYDSLVAKVNAMDSTYKAHFAGIKAGGEQLERGGIILMVGALAMVAGGVLAAIPDKSASAGKLGERQGYGVAISVIGTGLTFGGVVHIFAAGRNIHKLRTF